MGTTKLVRRAFVARQRELEAEKRKYQVLEDFAKFVLENSARFKMPDGRLDAELIAKELNIPLNEVLSAGAQIKQDLLEYGVKATEAIEKWERKKKNRLLRPVLNLYESVQCYVWAKRQRH